VRRSCRKGRLEGSAVPSLSVWIGFYWFASLPANYIHSWADLEKQFHKYFFIALHEMRLADLIAIRQRNDESVPEYIERFRDVRS
jgi:hypothetical protein